MGGEIEIDGSSNASLVKYNSLGEYQWDRTWGGAATDYISAIYIDSLDNVYITGKARSFGISDDVFIVKYDTMGNLIWNSTWGDASENDFGSDLFVDNQGNIFVAGFTSGFGVDGQDFLRIWSFEVLDCRQEKNNRLIKAPRSQSCRSSCKLPAIVRPRSACP